MKKGMKYLGIVLVAMVAVALVFAPVMAAEAEKAPAAAAEKAPAAAAEKAPAKKAEKKVVTKKEAVTVTGVVAEVKNKKGKVTSATIQSDKETCTIVRKAKGAAVAKLVGKNVEVTGTVSERKGKKYIYVKEFKQLN
ncbi:MAG: hypothetical protein BWK80_56305 [Desulfobacteraceae bacterium IS3]|nr:MAG: hypothetical protein BWK80_56305 [Desulfobacteraceae bacterium IS3]